MRNILDRDYALVQNLLAYVEDELRTQPDRRQLADLCRIAMNTLESEEDSAPQPAYRARGNLIDVRFSISGVPHALSCKCE